MKKIILLNSLALMLMLLPGLAQAADGTIFGKVVDENGLAMPGATITLNELPGKGTITDADGAFVMLDVPQGEHTMKISYIGYKAFEQKINVEEVSLVQHNVALEPGVILGDEVLVLGDRLKGQAKAINQQRANSNITNVGFEL